VTSALLLDADPVTPELYLDAGLPGFPGLHRFQLVPWGDMPGPFSLLQCLDMEDLAFVVVRPGLFFPDYGPQIGRDTADRLGIDHPDDAIVLAIVTLGATPAEATVNLLGPLVVNRHTGRAAQVVQDGARFSVRTPLRRG
jgi:flagellar assembly factor FliW